MPLLSHNTIPTWHVLALATPSRGPNISAATRSGISVYLLGSSWGMRIIQGIFASLLWTKNEKQYWEGTGRRVTMMSHFLPPTPYHFGTKSSLFQGLPRLHTPQHTWMVDHCTRKPNLRNRHKAGVGNVHFSGGTPGTDYPWGTADL